MPVAIKKHADVTPDEHIEQAHFFRFLGLLAIDNPECGLAYAVPNGARTSMSVAKRLKAEGMKSGVPDICFPVPRFPYHGLYIEMKRAGKSKTSNEQKAWISRLREQGYAVEVCKGFEEARTCFLVYLALPKWGKEISRRAS